MFTFEQLPAVVAELAQKVDTLIANQNQPTQNAHSEEQFPIQIREASQLLGLSISTLHIKCSRNEIPYYKQSGRLYFFKNELLAWLRQNRRKNQFEIDQQVDEIISANA